jgi:L-alanine-DL-glutamate epimerase-like enolase superfamily enzyme
MVPLIAELELSPVLFEQPVARDDWNGLHQVATEAFDRFGVLVAADESCRSMEDVTRIVKSKLAHVVNIKLCKMGILVALEVPDRNCKPFQIFSIPVE